MIEFAQLLLKLKLNTWKNEPANNFAIRVQYYSFVSSEWVTVFGSVVNAGILLIQKDTTGGTTAEMDLYELITYGKMPPMRIIPRDKIGGSEGIVKQPIIASSFVFGVEATTGVNQFVIDFGTMYMVPGELIVDSSTEFENILPIANYFPLSTPTPPEPENPPVAIQDLYANLVSEIATASDNNEGSPYKLSNISVKLKALIHEEGGSMSASLLNLENSENVNGDAISELVFDLSPVSTREQGGIPIPNLTGLTETAVRRILKSLGLKLNPVYQKKATVVNGDSFQQTPAQGVSVQPNQIVTVIFSKHE